MIDNGTRQRVLNYRNINTLKDPVYNSKFSLERNLLFLGVNIRGFNQFKQGCVKLAMSIIRPHLFTLVEVGKYSPSMPGYQLTRSTLRNFGGSLLYVRGDMLILKTDTWGDTVVTLFQPNKESIVCAVASYVSPNEKAYVNIVTRLEDYLSTVANAYHNI